MNNSLQIDEDLIEEERELIEQFYKLSSKDFPKSCTTCNRSYQSELDYIERTKRCGSAQDLTQYNILCFMRNCKCGSTLGLTQKYEQYPTLALYLLKYLTKELGIRAKQDLIKNAGQIQIPGELTAIKFVKDTRSLYDSNRAINEYLVNPEQQKPFILEESYFNDDEFWNHVGLNIFRDRYNSWLRNNEILPEHQVLFVDDGAGRNEFLRKIKIGENLHLNYVPQINEGLKSLAKNPEATSLMIIQADREQQRINDLVKTIRNYNETNANTIAKPFAGYTGGKTLPIILFIGEENYNVSEATESLRGNVSVSQMRDLVSKYCKKAPNITSFSI